MHFGTFLAVVVVYFSDVSGMVRSLISHTYGLITGRSGTEELWQDSHARLGLLLVVGSIPAAVIGLALRDTVEGLFDSLLSVGFFWLVTSGLLLLLRVIPTRSGTRSALGLSGALLIGLFQGAAIAPGISRSGSTIVGGVLAGLTREEAANFSFLLSLPAIAGATLLDLMKLPGTPDMPWNALVAGALAAALSGYLAITWLLQLVRRGKLTLFAAYTAALGFLVIVVELF